MAPALFRRLQRRESVAAGVSTIARQTQPGRRHTQCTAVCRRVPVCACAVDAMSGSAASDAIIQCILLNNASVGRHWLGPCRSTHTRLDRSLPVNAIVPTIVLIRRTRRPWVSHTSAAEPRLDLRRVEQIWRRLIQNESGNRRRSWGNVVSGVSRLCCGDVVFVPRDHGCL